MGLGHTTKFWLLAGFALLWLPLGMVLPTASETASKKGTNFEPPPGQDAPKVTTAGGRRTKPFCPGDRIASGIPLVPLVPASRFGLTTASHPTIFIFIPETSARTAEFEIFDAEDATIHRTTIALPPRAQLLEIALPETARALEPNRDYRWSLGLVCDPNDRARDRIATAWIHRVELSPERFAVLEAIDPAERALTYAQLGIWYDALTQLTQLQQERAQNPELQAAWQQLLQSAGLGFLADETPQPIVE